MYKTITVMSENIKCWNYINNCKKEVEIKILLTACLRSHELSSIFALSHIVVAHDGEIIFCVEFESGD